MSVTNIFLKDSVVQNFEKATFIPKAEFYRMADFIIEACHLDHQTTYNILDVGSGTGRTILNILSRFAHQKMKFSATCFDISLSMYQKFKEEMKTKRFSNHSVKFLIHDANNGIPDNLFPGRFDLIFIISVLHYLNDWRQFLHEVHRKMSRNAFLIQAELRGWYRLLDGSFDDCQEQNGLSLEFWRKYFKERQSYGSWKPDIKFSEMIAVRIFCEKEFKMKLVAEREFLWKTTIRWADVLSWIEIGPVSSLGSNINSDADRIKLRSIMAQFLSMKRVNQRKRFPVKWGFNVFIYQRRE